MWGQAAGKRAHPAPQVSRQGASAWCSHGPGAALAWCLLFVREAVFVSFVSSVRVKPQALLLLLLKQRDCAA